MKKFNLNIFLLCTIILFGCRQSIRTNDVDSSSLADDLDNTLTRLYKKNKFNGNVLVLRQGQMLYEKSFGYEDGAKKRKLSGDSRFGIGSVYKEFPAVAIMQLSEENKLNVNHTIDRYLPNLPNWSDKITITNLLQYSSGLPNIDFGKYFSNDIRLKDSDIVNDLMGLNKLEFQPGSDYLYSNYNPFLLIKIIERISNQDFHEFMQKKLFKPFRLENMLFKKQYPYLDTTSMANPLNVEFEPDEYKLEVQSLLLTATAKDLSQWMEALHTYKIITKESLHFLTETANIKGVEMQSPLGNCKVTNDEITVHTHHGSMGNYECLVKCLNSQGVTIIILTNQKNSNVFDICELIEKGILKME